MGERKVVQWEKDGKLDEWPMTFRQNEIFVKQFLWSAGVLTVVMAVLFLRDRELLPPLLVCLGMVLGPCVHVWRTEPMLTVDEWGVVCGDPERPVWSYPWAQIAQVRRITRFTSPRRTADPRGRTAPGYPVPGLPAEPKGKERPAQLLSGIPRITRQAPPERCLLVYRSK